MCMGSGGSLPYQNQFSSSPWDTLPPGAILTTTHKAPAPAPPPPPQPSVGPVVPPSNSALQQSVSAGNSSIQPAASPGTVPGTTGTIDASGGMSPGMGLASTGMPYPLGTVFAGGGR